MGGVVIDNEYAVGCRHASSLKRYNAVKTRKFIYSVIPELAGSHFLKGKSFLLVRRIGHTWLGTTAYPFIKPGFCRQAG
jgi:hypothetical protein